jgi:DNA-binding LacI/PurR family transcriptional regulator
MSVTIKDVARESGVNISTVSRALNHEYGVHPETREHVIAVASRLKYRPNRVARGLVTGRSNTLGLIVSDIRNPFFAEVARGAEDAARAAGCDLVLCNSDLNAHKQIEYVHSLLAKHVDGILMNSVAVLSRAQQDDLAQCPVPIVLLNGATSRRTFSTVSANNMAGGSLAAKYLLKLGHRVLAHITGPRRNGNLTNRARGFLKTVTADGRCPPPIVLNGENSFHGGYELTQRLLAGTPNFTALFAANDIMAFGAVRAIYESGRRIPEDLSLIGFDNVELASAIHPPLTTIHQPKYEIGQAAVEILLARAGKHADRSPEFRVLDVELIERQSCQSV